MNENICAISTSLGVGAISIVRCSGPDVIEITNKIFKGRDLTKVASHTINYGFIMDNDQKVDEVLVSVMRGPKTFTCEDVVEINCHGGIQTTNRVLELLIINGCRIASAGEFTKKAFLNGRIDLIEAEGINDLISSDSEESRKYAINMLDGNLSKLIKSARKILVELEANLEVDFDYPEEVDNPKYTHEIVINKLSDIKETLKGLVSTTSDTRIIKDGIDVAIVGKPNVGKSSILNHLLGQNKAIVTNIAGTTRDIVEGSITINGIKVNLIDTAGIRETDDVVEKIGVDKSKSIIKEADLVIYVLNNNEMITEEEMNMINNTNNVKNIIFINKSDLDPKINISQLDKEKLVYGNTVSADGLNNLKERIVKMFNLSEIKSKNYNILSNARQIALVKQALNSIDNAIKACIDVVPLEMIEVDINDAFNLLGEIIGETYKEELLDEMFSKFCLGK